MARLHLTLLVPFVLTYFIVLIPLYEAQILDEPRHINCTPAPDYCSPDFPPPPIRPGVDDVVVFENNQTAVGAEQVLVACDLVFFGDWRAIKKGDTAEGRTFALTKPNLRNDTVPNPWMSCRFLRHAGKDHKACDWAFGWRREFTPPRVRNQYQPFESYLNVSLEGKTRGNGSVTHVYMNDTGIFVGQELLAVWGGNQGLISTDPGFKSLNSRDGSPCYSICMEKEPHLSTCYSGFKRKICDPRDDYDIRKYAVNGVLTAEGLPCVRTCEWGFRSEDMEDAGYACGLRTIDENPEIWNFGWCSPSPGLTIHGDNCTGPCTYTNHDHSSCAVAGGSRRSPCSVF